MPFMSSARASFGVQGRKNTPWRAFRFSTHTFTTAGLSGPVGPSLAQVRSAYSATSWANTFLNMSINGYQQWTVPSTGYYRITAAGAGAGGQNPGAGATVSGTFYLSAATLLNIIVGQTGNQGSGGSSGGGGGGSFVVNGSTPLIIAGGGGGGGDDGFGSSASVSESANGGQSPGTSGSGGGSGGAWGGAGGAGFFSNGAGSYQSGSQADTGGRSYANGLSNTSYQSSYGAAGGFGGGGAASWAPGGGGGYSGGGGRNSTGSGSDHNGGGGGGSYNSGTNQTSSVGNQGQGYVTITKL